MNNTIDLFLGAFLILSGFALSLINLQRTLKDTKFSSVLLSENILLMCIGLAFVVRAVHELNIVNAVAHNVEERAAEFMVTRKLHQMNCSFWSMLMSYGPLIVSMVNSFMSLIIDNYMHYKMLGELKEKDEENTVQDISDVTRIGRKLQINRLVQFWRKYISYVMIALQWLVPILVALIMYPMGVNKMELSQNEFRSASGSCMAMLDYSNQTCSVTDNETVYAPELRQYFLPPKTYLEAHDQNVDRNKSIEINNVIKNVLNIISNVKEESYSSINVTSSPLTWNSKNQEHCANICYIDNKNLLLYMFVLAIVTYFVPITISTVILTKIHLMDIKKHNVKTYVTRELLYNILFWTPVMLDNFLSLILCSYSSNEMRTSLFNAIANVYQAVKNFMNTKYFKDNSVNPV